MNENLWRQIEASRLAFERATRGIDMTSIALAAEKAQQATSALGLFTLGDQISAKLAASEQVLKGYERLGTNAAIVAESIASALATRLMLPDVTALGFKSLQIEPPVIMKFEIPQFDLPKDLFLTTQLQDLLHLNDAVSGAFNSIAWDNLAATDLKLGQRLMGLSDSYHAIFAGLSKIEGALPDFVMKLPPRDMIVKSAIVSSCAVDFEPAHAAIDLDDPAYARSDVDLMLADLDPDLVTMLDEAIEVISGNSIGRVRHVSVSLRELCTHVLHRLAPDDEVRSWTKDPNHFHEDRPTRQARVLYACRHINYGPYGTYLRKSVSASVAFFEALNGLHDVRPDVCDFQLRLMLTDALGILRFLLRTAKYRP